MGSGIQVEALPSRTAVAPAIGRVAEAGDRPGRLLQWLLIAAWLSVAGTAMAWGWDYYSDERVVDVHIRNLRKALDDNAAEPRWIGTVRGVGYRFLSSDP